MTRAPLLQLMAALLLALLAGPASAQATIKTTLVSGDPLLTSDTLTLQVAVETNGSGKVPISGSLRVRFPEDALAWQSVVERDLGLPLASPADEDDVLGDGVKFRDVTTAGANPVTATDETPVIFEVKFTVLPGATTVAPYQVTVEADPAAGANALFWLETLPPNTGPIAPLTFDNNAVSILTVDGWKQLEH